MDNHIKFMQIALELAKKGRGMVEPNPLVGAVIVRDNRIVGKGYHRAFGLPHAEVNAINDAGSPCKDATLYVSMEPCAHFGKTPPCVDAIKQAGINRVFFAVYDPNPITMRNGVKALKEAGIEVIGGVLEDEARDLNAPFFKLMTEKMPYVIAKWAMSLDGKIATMTGNSQWISGEKSKAYVHKLRGLMDGIIVGIGTVLVDDPLLTCRAKFAKRRPKRIVIDSKALLPLNSRLINTINEAEVFVATTYSAPEERIKRLESAGCKIIRVNSDNNRLVDLNQIFKELGNLQFTNVLIEGGSRIFGSLFDNDLVDKVLIFISSKIIGGANALSPVTGKGVFKVSEAIKFDKTSVKGCGHDIVIEAVRKRP